MSNPVYYIEPDEMGSLEVGSTFCLVGEEGHHARTVKRAEVAEGIDLVDGLGNRAVSQVQEITPDGLVLTVLSLTQDQQGVSFYLVQALAKGDRDIQAIEMATELGAHGIVPWSADRSIVRWKMERAVKARTKWQNTVRAAAKQSRRAVLPPVYDQHSTADLAELAEELGDTALFLVLHEDADYRLTEALQVHLSPAVQEVYVLVGPEGGISPRELDVLTQAGAKTVLLGPEVLRSSTAGAAALSALNCALGRW
ncbi:16S rRNA (uracil(1498)-N(3))-methyltransferase [Rothia nasimurium]|uniref:16S rRNA (uracil(1498)-N(3))-methyltransferase n=1 Tax=Rothia nasimurium TaxID=85336 RepID=UPI001F0016C0|nr:16S rRNA (uracil(1498)-N(3))-methyltransferase [Rothia nasimurium]